jgi:RNA polymerase sigma-70 factor (ECF subfamily)
VDSPSKEAGRETDRQLVKEALSGEPGFEKLVKTYERMVYRVAFRFLNDETDASDVTQEVFFRVYRSLADFRGNSALSSWIYAITANLSRNAIRSRKNREKVQVLAPEDPDGDGPSFWEKVKDGRQAGSAREMESRDLHGAIREAVADLPLDYREAVILRDLEDMDYQEIAVALKTGLGTVKSRIARGRLLLREKLKDWL